MSPGALAETRAEIAARELGEVTLPRADREDTHAKWATHPYVGYVLDPTVESWLTPDGTSVWGADDVPPARGPERYVVGLFGGSVAFLMGSDHHEALRDALLLARKLMKQNVGHARMRTTRRRFGSSRLWVYGRKNEPCFECGTPLDMRRQGEQGRSTYFCPRCQAG
ncbi:MAG TPA: hypothetical protein DEF51_12150 [Myxococcales bacterium]|nr:hypothetical protein [Myxococcales bacterium]